MKYLSKLKKYIIGKVQLTIMYIFFFLLNGPGGLCLVKKILKGGLVMTGSTRLKTQSCCKWVFLFVWTCSIMLYKLKDTVTKQNGWFFFQHFSMQGQLKHSRIELPCGQWDTIVPKDAFGIFTQGECHLWLSWHFDLVLLAGSHSPQAKPFPWLLSKKKRKKQVCQVVFQPFTTFIFWMVAIKETRYCQCDEEH